MLCFIAPTVHCALTLGVYSQKDSAQPAGSVSDVMTSVRIEGPGVTVKTARGETAVPQNPEYVAVYDFGISDTSDKLGVSTGMSVDRNLLPHLDAYSKQTKSAETLFGPGYKALDAHKPQLAIIDSRIIKAFDQLSRIVPTIEMTTGIAHLKDSAKERTDALAQIFGRQVEVDKLKAEIDTSFGAAKVAALSKGKGLVILVSGGKISAFDTSSRLDGWFHRDIGVPAADSPTREKNNHGQPVTFEYIRKTNPNWLFVLDRPIIIGEKGKTTEDVLDNPLVVGTITQEKGQVVYPPPEAYLAAGSTQELLNASEQVTKVSNTAE